MQQKKKSNKLWILEASLYLDYLTDHVSSFCRASWSSLPFASGDLVTHVTQILPNQIPNKVCSVSSTRMICLGWFQRGPSDSWKKVFFVSQQTPCNVFEVLRVPCLQNSGFKQLSRSKWDMQSFIAKECQGTLLDISDISISFIFGCFASCSSNCSFQAALASRVGKTHHFQTTENSA